MSTVSLGSFVLVRPIARGGMAEVWEGTHATGERVAIKLVTRNEPDLVEAIRREVRAVARLDHPHVVWVHDQGLVDEEVSAALDGRVPVGSPWFAMEPCDGGTLRNRADEPSWGRVRGVLLDLLDALAHAHARGVVHRDLKPANVLFKNRAGRRPQTKLSDFGLAHRFETAETPIHAGTPAYMAPEQLVDEEQGPWTDLYALGCLAWWLTTGATPFRASDAEGWARAHAAAPLPTWVPTTPTPPAFEGWLRRALAKRPSDRFRRAADAAHALAQLPKTFAGRGSPRLATIADQPTVLIESSGSGSSSVPASFTLAPTQAAPADLGAATIPPVPADWRQTAGGGRGEHLLGAGLGLFGLRRLPLVGREVERDRLWEVAKEAEASGETRVVVLEGPAGVGKSRLAAWFLERLHEVGAGEPFRAEHQPDGGPLDGLPGLVARALGVVGRSAVALRTVAKARLEDDSLVDAVVELVLGRTDVPAARRNRAVAHTMRRLAAGRLPVLWLDDVQWGPDTLRFASRLVERKERAVVVVTARRDLLTERPEAAALLAALPATRVSLGPLSVRHRTELVRTLLGLETELAARIDERAGGHPLFVVQLVTSLVERGALVRGPRGFTLAPGGFAPVSLADAWSGRLAPILADDPARRRALELAAVLGQAVDRAEWEAACRAGGVPADRALLDELAARQLIEVDETGFSFAHGLLREVVLEGARRGGRFREHHDAVVRGLAPMQVAEERLGAWLLAAGRGAEALPLLEQASLTADRRGEYSRNLWLRNRIGELVDEVCGHDHVRRSVALRKEALVVRNLGRSAEARALLEAVVARCRRLGHEEVLTFALDDLSSMLGELGDLEGCLRAAAEAWEVAERLGHPEPKASAATRLSTAHGRAGRTEEAERWARVALAAPAVGATRAMACFNLVTCRSRAADWDAAVAFALEGRAAAVEDGNVMLAADLDRTLGDAYSTMRRPADADRCYAASRKVYEASESAMVAIVAASQGWSRYSQGDLAGADALFRESLEVAERSGRAIWVTRARFGCLTTAAGLGDWEAFDAVADALERRTDLELLPYYLQSLASAARAAVDAGRRDQARRALGLAAALRAAGARGDDADPLLDELERELVDATGSAGGS